jgi:hypothetical protein
MKILRSLQFYGNHSLDFDNNEIDAIKYYVVKELRKIPIPDEIYLAAYDSLIKLFGLGFDLSKAWEFDTWYCIR